MTETAKLIFKVTFHRTCNALSFWRLR